MVSSALAAALERRNIHYGWVIVAVTLRIVTRRPSWCLAFVPFADRRSPRRSERPDLKAARRTRARLLPR